jgi:hypothetical protein
MDIQNIKECYQPHHDFRRHLIMLESREIRTSFKLDSKRVITKTPKPSYFLIGITFGVIVSLGPITQRYRKNAKCRRKLKRGGLK